MAAEPYFHSVKARKGDGIHKLLRRYQLTQSACNLSKFLELNKLSQNAHLKAGHSYTLPIYIYTYNGVSIRSTIGDNDWDKAVRIKRYNEAIRTQGLRLSDYVSSKILWVPYSEVKCSEVTVAKTDATPTAVSSSASSRTVPLFGKKYEKVDIIDRKLKGQVFYVVAGHGGPDPGAMCTDCASTLCEDEYAYDVSLRLARDLMQHGATVHIIIQDANDGIRDGKHLPCDKDERCMGKLRIPLNHKKRLYQRSNEINRLYRHYRAKGIKTQRTIVIHVDSNSKNKSQDVFFYYHKKSKTGKKLALNTHQVFKSKYEKYQKGRGYHGTVKHRNLHMLRAVSPPTLFVELANIRNRYDHKRILLNANRQALANWLFEGVTGIEQ